MYKIQRIFHIRYFISSLFLFCLLPSSLFGQTITIEGIITDAITGKAIEGAVVAIGDSMSVAETGSNTDEKGKYTMSIDAKGRTTIKILAELTTYANYTAIIPINGEHITKNIILSPNYATEDIVITATKGLEQKEKEVTVSISKVSQKAINLQTTSGISKVITQIPGVDNLGGQISIRGSSGYAYGVGSRVLVLLDGLPLLSGDRGAAELDFVPVDNIKSVEVMKGASSVMYGSAALGGVINIITNEVSAKPTTSIRFREGFYGAPRNKNLDWDGSSASNFASLHVFHQRRIGNFSLTAQTDLIKNTGYILNTESKAIRAFLNTKYKPKSISGLIVGLNLGYSDDNSGTTIFWDRYEPKKWSVVTNPQDTILQGGGLNPSSTGGVYSRIRRKLYTLDPSIKYLSNKGHLFWYRGRFLNNGSLNNNGSNVVNYVTYNDFIYQQSLGKHINWVSGITSFYTYTYAPSIFGGARKQSSIAAYSQLDAKYGRLNVSAGVRYESVQTNVVSNSDVQDSLVSVIVRNTPIIERRANQPIFRGGVNYEVWRGANARASIGQAFRVPTIAEYFAKVGISGVNVTPNLERQDTNKIVKPEKGYSAEIALRQGYRAGVDGNENAKFKGYLDIAAFVMKYNNMMEFGVDKVILESDFSTTAYFATRNVAKARITGLELTTLNSYEVNPNFSLNLSGGFTYIDPRNLQAVDSANQLDLSFFNISDYDLGDAFDMLTLTNPNSKYSDNPALLKYRNRWLVRNSLGFNYKKIGFNTNYRYRSFTQQIDQYLYLVVGDLADFRAAHPNGEHVFDIACTYNMTNKSMVSVNIDNIANVEYFTIPGTLGEQRKFTVQYQVKF